MIPILNDPNNPPPEPPKLVIAHFELPEEFAGYYADAKPATDEEFNANRERCGRLIESAG